MKTHDVVILILILIGGVFVFTRSLSAPASVPREAAKQKAEDFVPAGWSVIAKAEGDLNGDGVTDTVLAIEDTKTGEADFHPRSLLILLQNKTGDYELSIRSDTVIPHANEGGIFGDPFSGISIEKGSVAIDAYGGSAWRWSYSYQFRYQNAGWYLIGQTSGEFFNGDECMYKTTSQNFLTKRKQEIVSSRWDDYTRTSDINEDLPCTEKETWSSLENKELLNLKDFGVDDPFSNSSE